jgi:hypothetical protein
MGKATEVCAMYVSFSHKARMELGSFPGLTDAIGCRTSVFMVNISAANRGGYYPNGAQQD